MRLLRSLQSAILALQSILALLQLLDVFKVWYFPMIHRTAYSLQFNLGFSLAPALLLLSSAILAYMLKWKRYRVILISISASMGIYPLIGFNASVACFSLLLVAASLQYFGEFEEYMFWVLVLLTGFEGIALIHWVFLPLGFVSPLIWFADLELALFYVFAHLAPLMVISIIFILFLKPLVQRYLRVKGEFLTSRLHSKDEFYGEKIHLYSWTLLALSLVISVIGALYPYSSSINPEGVPVGVDVHYYLEWMVPVEQSLYSAFTVANGSRPMMLLMIYVFQHGFGFGALEAVKYLPILLNPLFVLSVFFMVLHATEDWEWASLASLFSASGFAITVGMYSYFLTNMLGLILIFSAIGFLFKAIRTRSKVFLASASALGSLAVYTHPWTFTQYYAATALFLIYKYFRDKRFNESLIVLTYLGITGFVDVLKGLMGGLEVYGAITSTAPNVIELTRFWSNNIFAFRQMYGGLLSNTVLLGLATFGVYSLNRRKPYHLFLSLLLLVSSLYYLMVDGSDQTKLLYNIPFGVLASLVILLLIRDTTFNRRINITFMLFTETYMIVYLLRSLANLL